MVHYGTFESPASPRKSIRFATPTPSARTSPSGKAGKIKLARSFSDSEVRLTPPSAGKPSTTGEHSYIMTRTIIAFRNGRKGDDASPETKRPASKNAVSHTMMRWINAYRNERKGSFTTVAESSMSTVACEAPREDWGVDLEANSAPNSTPRARSSWLTWWSKCETTREKCKSTGYFASFAGYEWFLWVLMMVAACIFVCLLYQTQVTWTRKHRCYLHCPIKRRHPAGTTE